MRLRLCGLSRLLPRIMHGASGRAAWGVWRGSTSLNLRSGSDSNETVQRRVKARLFTTVLLVAQAPARGQPPGCGGHKVAAEHGGPVYNALQFILLTRTFQPNEHVNDVNHDLRTIFTLVHTYSAFFQT